MHPRDEDAEHDEDLEDDDLDEGEDDDEGTGGGHRVDHTEERTYDENYEPDEDDKDAEWYDAHFGGPDEDEEDEMEAELEYQEFEDYEYEDGGGIVTSVLLANPTEKRRYQNVCWNCTKAVDDESLPRCSKGCGWVRCSCNSCLCDMLLHRRLERPHTVKLEDVERQLGAKAADDQIARIFRSSCWLSATVDELATVNGYTVNVLLSGPGGSMQAARSTLQVGALVRASGAGVFIDKSLTCTHEKKKGKA